MGIGREGRLEAGKVGWVHNAQGLERQLMGFPFMWYETGETHYYLKYAVGLIDKSLKT